MRTLRTFLALFALTLTAFAQAPADIEKKLDAILSQMSLEEKIDYIGGDRDFYVRPVPRAGVREMKMSDGPIGLRNDGPATTLAGGIALAATWDADLARRAGEALGDDARSRGVHFLLGPAVNIYRAPMNGRNFEYMGEDPYLASRTAVAYIQGVQSKGVCATVKHFAANNQEFLRHDADSIVDERTLREIYLPAFEAAVKDANVCAIMDSYNLINGVHASQNGHLNLDIAKGDWNFAGIIMSDWDSTYDGVGAVNGGLDIEMPSGKFMNRATLLPAVKAGKVSEATINDHVRRILRRALQHGFFDREQRDRSIPIYNPAARSVALETARSSMVLLKNEGNLLPLDKNKTKSIAIIGPNAYPAVPVGGGSAAVHPFHAVSYLEGLANYAPGQVSVLFDQGLPSLYDLAEATAFTTDVAGTKPGVVVERFTPVDLAGKPNVVTEKNINFGSEWVFSRSIPREYRSVRWTGYYHAKTDADLEVFTQGPAEDGYYRVFIDDRLAIDNWKRVNALVPVVRHHFTAGAHKIRVELRRTFGDCHVRLGILDPASVVSEEAKKLAARADAVIVSVGFNEGSESEGADRTFRLPPAQNALIQAMRAANKNTIVLINSGGGTDMTFWLDQVPAVFQGWYGGQEAGTAFAQILFGDASPSGKLPATFDRTLAESAIANSHYPNDGDIKIHYTEGVFIGYRHYDRAKTKPLFAFGYGLSYSKFTYSNLAITPGDAANPATVSFDLTNSGQREAAEIAEVYVGDNHPSVPRPAKELKGYVKVSLKPGETRHLTVPLDARAFQFYNEPTHAWKADAGTYTISVGGSSDSLPLTTQFRLSQ